MALRGQGKRHVQSWPVVGSLLGGGGGIGYSVAWLNEAWVLRQREFTGNGYYQLFRCAALCSGPCVSMSVCVCGSERHGETWTERECVLVYLCACMVRFL